MSRISALLIGARGAAALIALAIGSTAVSGGAARAEDCVPSYDEADKAPGKTVKGALFKWQFQLKRKTQHIPATWKYGCSTMHQEGRAYFQLVFLGPEADGTDVVGETPGIGDTCEPTVNVGVHADHPEDKWPGSWQKSIFIGFNDQSPKKTNLYVPNAWRVGCTFVERYVIHGAVYSHYLGPGAPTKEPPAAVEPETTDVDVNVSIDRPKLPAYSRSGDELKQSWDDFSGKK